MSRCVNNRTSCIQDVTLSSSKRSLLISSFWTLHFLSARASPLSFSGMLHVQSAVLLLCSDSFIKTLAAAPTAAVATRYLNFTASLTFSSQKLHASVSLCLCVFISGFPCLSLSCIWVPYYLRAVSSLRSLDQYLAFMLLRVPLHLTYTYLYALTLWKSQKPEWSKCKYCK